MKKFNQGDLVWVKSPAYRSWGVRWYSHYDTDSKMHHCFVDQQRKGETADWNRVKPFDKLPKKLIPKGVKTVIEENE